MADDLHATEEAERKIEARKKSGGNLEPQHRQAAALEAIADDLTRLYAEVKTLRYLFATYAARQGR
jgi:hypothetical protein